MAKTPVCWAGEVEQEEPTYLMARIEEQEITAVDGRVIKRRIMQADSIRITHPDGTVEELRDLPEDFRAVEDPWTLADQPARWELHNSPLGSFGVTLNVRLGRENLPRLITLLNENGEVLLNLGAIFAELLKSADRDAVLVGEEIP